MRLVNRPLAFIVAAVLIAASVVIIAEVIGFAAHQSPLLVHWTTWYHWARTTRWDAFVVRVWSAILIVDRRTDPYFGAQAPPRQPAAAAVR